MRSASCPGWYIETVLTSQKRKLLVLLLRLQHKEMELVNHKLNEHLAWLFASHQASPVVLELEDPLQFFVCDCQAIYTPVLIYPNLKLASSVDLTFESLMLSDHGFRSRKPYINVSPRIVCICRYDDESFFQLEFQRLELKVVETGRPVISEVNFFLEDLAPKLMPLILCTAQQTS